MKRSEVREAVFYLVFESMFSGDSPDEILDTAYEADAFEMDETVENKFKAVMEKQGELDGIITEFSKTREFGRIPKVLTAIMRIALYEALYDPAVPENVAVSEAVLLAQKYAYENDVQFVNGLLGAFVRSRNENSGA